MNEEFGRILMQQMDFYNSPNADQFGAVQKKLDDVRNVMVGVKQQQLYSSRNSSCSIDGGGKGSNSVFFFGGIAGL